MKYRVVEKYDEAYLRCFYHVQESLNGKVWFGLSQRYKTTEEAVNSIEDLNLPGVTWESL